MQVYSLDVTTNDLVYDAVTNKIYVSIPSSNGSNGNSIGRINPVTHVLEGTVFIGSEPTVLAISDDGQFIYSGFSGASIVRRYNVVTQTAGLQWSLGSDSSTGAYYVEDIEVMPGQPHTIAISRKNNGFSPRHEGVAIYDDNVMRPTTTPDHTGSNRIEFTGPNSLIGYNNETTEFGIRRLAVNAGGVTNISVTQSVLSNFYLDFSYWNNRMFSFDGKVVDITTSPFVMGQFTNASGPVVYDPYYNKACFASYDFSGNITFKRFDPETFLLSDSLPISQAFGTVKNIITCGNGCYAFNTSGNKVVIINDPTLGISSSEKLQVSVYPNPADGYLAIESPTAIKDVQLIDLSGRFVMNPHLDGVQVSLDGLASGIYLAKITDVNGASTIEKFVKK